MANLFVSNVVSKVLVARVGGSQTALRELAKAQKETELLQSASHDMR